MSASNGKPPQGSKLPVAHDTPNGAGNSGIASEAGLKPLQKITSNPASLNVPYTSRRGRSQSLDTLSLISVDDLSELRTDHLAPPVPEDDDFQPTPLPLGWKGAVKRSWTRNKGLVWVVLAQAFGVLMNVSTRLLESEANGAMHPFQILFVRMSITSTLAMLYMYYTKTPEFPLGAKSVRGILVARGLGGFFGVFGLYWSLRYLPLADTTVLTFLAPMIACWICSKLLHDSFTFVEQIGAFVSLIGVILIARPTSLFSSSSSSTSASHHLESSNSTADIATSTSSDNIHSTSSHRLQAVGVAMIGVMGASVAYVTIRWIGKRAHPLISVNYFAVWCTIVSGFSLAFIPSIPFILPSTWTQWGLLLLIGIGGFVMQFLLTAGLRYEKGSRATNMIYSQMLFALAADKIIWNDTPGLWSLTGSALILGSAIVIAVQKAGSIKTKEEEIGPNDEEAAIMEGAEDADRSLETSPLERSSIEDARLDSTQRPSNERQSTEPLRRESSDSRLRDSPELTEPRDMR